MKQSRNSYANHMLFGVPAYVGQGRGSCSILSTKSIGGLSGLSQGFIHLSRILLTQPQGVNGFPLAKPRQFGGSQPHCGWTKSGTIWDPIVTRMTQVALGAPSTVPSPVG